MELTFLGTSAGAPTVGRNVSGLALRDGAGWDLFDCGEATQHQLLRTPLSLAKLRRVFISHLHGDHCFGLFGLLGSRSMSDGKSPLHVFGPAGLEAMIEVVLRTSDTHLNYELVVHEVDADGGRVYDDARQTIDAIPLTHRVTSFAWFIHEADRPGQLDVDAARALGVPDGPMFGRLQRGERVELDDGTMVDPADVVGPERPGRRVVIAGDNSDPAGLFERTPGAHLAVHEATYTEAVLAKSGNDYGHSTAARVAAATEDAGIENLVLTHFSARFADDGDGFTLADIETEASEHFAGNLHLAHDFDHLTLSPDGTLTQSD